MFNIDRHIAILSGWIAGPALGVAMMAAPVYFQLSPGIVSGALFWGGIAVFGATIIVVLVLSLHEQQQRKAVAGPVILMAIGALIFGGGAAWYFWPKEPVSTQKPWKHTLEELYASEFADLGNQERQFSVRMSSNGKDFEFASRFRLYPDFRSGTEFVSLFIPTTNRVDHDGRIFNLIMILPEEIKKTQQQMQHEVGLGISGPGLPYRDSQSLVFTGRVYIYTEQPLTIVQLGELTSSYQTKGLQLEIRGHDYWWANRNR